MWMTMLSAAGKQSKLPAQYRLNRNLAGKVWSYRTLYVMGLAGFAYFFIFKYVTLYGLLIVFKTYRIRDGILGSPWAGLTNFRMILTNPDLLRITYNTLLISFCRLLIGFPVPIILALLLNELHSPLFKKTVQSVLYFPYFLSWIIVAGICSNLFSITNGVIPLFFRSIGIEMPSLIADPKYFVGFMVGTDVWKNAGWGTIIYLAAISGIDVELYESAIVDGANRLQQVIHITIPSIAVSIVTLLVLNVGGIMNAGFDQIFNFYGPTTLRVADIIDTYVYRLGIQTGKFEYAAIIGLCKSIINCLLLFTVNWIAGKIGESSPL
jgi:putative aldouronate transport system permease protein